MKSSFGGFDVKRLLYVLADFGPNKRTASIRFYPYRQLDRLQQLDRPATRIRIMNDFSVLSWLFGTSRPRLGGEVGHLHSRRTLPASHSFPSFCLHILDIKSETARLALKFCLLKTGSSFKFSNSPSVGLDFPSDGLTPICQLP